MLTEVQEILPVPESPIDVDEAVLHTNMQSLKVSFPADYVAYSRVYGSGTICVEVYDWEIYSGSRPSYPDYVKCFFERQDAYRTAMKTLDVSFGLFPEPGGLLPFGGRDDVYFTWKTRGDPGDWKVVVLWLYEKGGYQEFEMDFVHFLANLLTRNIRVAGFKSSWNPRTDVSFQSEVFSG